MSEDRRRAALDRLLELEKDSLALKKRREVEARRFQRDFQSLKPLEWTAHVRRRPQMWLGDIGTPGKHVALLEFISNSIDQFLGGKASFVSLDIKDDWIEINDDGEGFPLNVYSGAHPTSLGEDLLLYKKPLNPRSRQRQERASESSSETENYEINQIRVYPTSYLTDIHFTATADHHAPHIHLSTLNGVGVAPVNALCQKLTVQAWRSGELWEQRFSKGVPLCDPFMVKKGDGRGTRWRFQLDPEIFEDVFISSAILKRQFREAACLFPGLILKLGEEEFYSETGLLDLCRHYSKKRPRPEDSWSYQCVRDKVRMDVAVLGRARKTSWRSYANGAHCADGGTHEQGLKAALRSVNWKPELAAIHVIFEDPIFSNPNATKLGTEFIRNYVIEALKGPLQEHINASRY